MRVRRVVAGVGVLVGIAAGIVTIIAFLTPTRPPPTPPPVLRPLTVSAKGMPIRVAPGGIAAIQVEVLAPGRGPVRDAQVSVTASAGVFARTGTQQVSTTTNHLGFAAVDWTAPGSPGVAVHFDTVVTAAGYEGGSARTQIIVQ